jgi:hypothetical protein
MLIVLSMTMATQYATTKVAYTFGIVHPSNADIRFIGSDNSSGNGSRVLRIVGNTSGNQAVVISLGDWMPNSNKTYTAAFGIVNEEPFSVNITHINISGTGATDISIWVHKSRTVDAINENSTDNGVLSVHKGVSSHTSANCEWTLGAGDGNTSTMNGASYATRFLTYWDIQSHVRYNDTCATAATNGTSDFVWVQINLNIPSGASLAPTATGQMWIHFEASTHS